MLIPTGSFPGDRANLSFRWHWGHRSTLDPKAVRKRPKNAGKALRQLIKALI